MKPKVIFLICALCLAALFATACVQQKALLPYEGLEFEIEATGAGSSTFVSFRADDGILYKLESTSVRWYYDRPDDGYECAVVSLNSEGEGHHVEFHLHESKNPESKG